MRRQVLITVTDVLPEALWQIIADVPNWPSWDPEIESVGPTRKIAPNPVFVVKPRSGSPFRMTISASQSPRRFAYTSHPLLARVRTEYDFEPIKRGTLLRVTIESSGLLGACWHRLHADQLGKRLSQLTRRLVRKARETRMSAVPTSPIEAEQELKVFSPSERVCAGPGADPGDSGDGTNVTSAD